MRGDSAGKEEEAKLASTLKMDAVQEEKKAPVQNKVLTKSGSRASAASRRSAGSKASRTASKESEKRSKERQLSKSKSKVSVPRPGRKSSSKLGTKTKKRKTSPKKRSNKPMVFDDFVLPGFGSGKTPQDVDPSR